MISLLSGLIMALAWFNVMGMGFLMLIAFVPLLFVEDYISRNNSDKRFVSTYAFVYSLPAFLLYTFPNTWWISNASPVGYIVPVAEAVFMSAVFQIYSYSKKVAKNKQGAYFFLVIYWIAFEYLQFTWDINFPWLNLGNSFARCPALVQWYSVTGIEGGTLWILLSNILIYFLIVALNKNKTAFKEIKTTFYKNKTAFHSTDKAVYSDKVKYGIFAALILVIPVTWSLILWYGYEDKAESSVSAVIVQPNLDPYKEQYNLPPQNVVQRVEDLAAPLMDSNVDFLVLPESCIQEYAWEDYLDEVPSICELQRFLSLYGNADIIAGMSTRNMLPLGVKTNAAREYPGLENRYYESCNTAIMFNKKSSLKDIQLRHKSVLVVGVEKMPFTQYFPFIENLVLDMGGTVGTLGIDDTVKVFDSGKKHIKIGVPICWESIDGNYCREFIKKGAGFLQVVTNVGWWGDTPGHKQYFAISRLRAIENRRYVAICANTGFSGLVNAKGQEVDKGGYWKRQAFKYDIPLTEDTTFFTRHGDMIMRPFAFIAVLLLLFSVVRNKTEKNKEK